MSINKALSAYEKMLADPKNQVSTAGQLRQNTPFGAGPNGIREQVIPKKASDQIDPADQEFLNSVDNRMVAKAKGLPVTEQLNGDLENRLKEVENLLIEVMKVHVKIIEKGLV